MPRRPRAREIRRLRATGVAAACALAVVAPAVTLTGCARTGPAQEAPVRGWADGSIDPPLSPRNASYTIDARLDPVRRTIAGAARIAWRNISSRPTDELQFHLYWNAWKDTRSTFMRELALTHPIDPRPSDLATMDVTSVHLRLPVDRDLTPTLRFLTTDTGSPDDETVVAVTLPEPVPPGGAVDLDVAWTARVPRTIARTGVVGDHYFVAHWFPKLGVLEDGGWHTRPFHAATEFYADYGVYDVRLTVPSGWTVGATGVERERTDHADGTSTHRYLQEDVHDFTWTASPSYVERTALFEPADRRPDGRADGSADGRVHLRLLLQPEHLRQAERHFDAARATLDAFTGWFGAYPYGHLTIVDPAWRTGADGMEYPTLVAVGTRWLAPDDDTVDGPEEVVVHEVAHQWWQGMVGSNEVDHAWIDEGLATYLTGRVMEQAYPRSALGRRYFGGFVPWMLPDIRLTRETYWDRRAGYLSAPSSEVPSTPSYLQHQATARVVTYNKTALWLHTAERWLGWPVMQRALATFFERGRFGHPGPDEFFQALQDAAGRDLSAFVDAVHRSSGVFDYGVESLRSRPEGRGFRTDLVVRRFGDEVFPVDVLVTFADGERVTERWEGAERWARFSWDRAVRAASAEVDPGRVLLLDVNWTNNSATLEPRAGEAATKWALKWMVWLQDRVLTWVLLV